MSLREEFVVFASQPGANIAALCRSAGISRKTGYKWLARRRAAPDLPLADCSRRPLRSPGRTDAEIERRIVQMRRQHPAWGARKLKRRLEDLAQAMPARSTVNGILSRHGLIDPRASAQHTPTRRFERSSPNELWQMDFKGHFAVDAGRCHPLTMLDDCSRFNLLLRACVDETCDTVKQGLIDAMRQYGMPQAILADNGPPWGDCGQGNFTTLSLWLMRRGVRVLHGRPRHPQTQGKEERFHRTLKVEAIGNRRFVDCADCQRVFDAWRQTYNLHRPHEALDLCTPASRYTPASRAYSETPPPIEYAQTDQVRRVCAAGRIRFHGVTHRIGKAFAGEPVSLRPTTRDGNMAVYYCHQQIAEIDLRGESK
jgi:transposase InsO family protein